MSCGKVSWAGLKRSDEVVALIRRLFSSFDDRWFIVASGSHVFSASMAVGAEGVDHRHRSPEQILACGLYCRRDLTKLCQHAQCSVSLSCCSVSLTPSAGLWFFFACQLAEGDVSFRGNCTHKKRPFPEPWSGLDTGSAHRCQRT